MGVFMSSKNKSRLISALFIGFSVLLIVLLLIPFQYSISRNGNGPYVLTSFDFFRSTSKALWWHDYDKDGDYYFVKIIVVAFTCVILALGVGGIATGLVSLLMPEKKVLHKVMFILVVVGLVITSLFFLCSVAAAVVTAMYKNKAYLFTEIVYAPILALAIFEIVLMTKYKKAE